MAFKAIGKQLKKIRVDDDLEVMLSYLPEQEEEVKDPAEEVKRMLWQIVNRTKNVANTCIEK